MVFEAWTERAAELEAEIYALYLAFRDRRTPVRAKLVIALIVAYAISPIDPIPDVIPGVGYLDELVLLPVGITVALWLIPDELMHDCRDRAGDEIDVGRARWIVAAIVVLIWIAISLMAIRTITNWLK